MQNHAQISSDIGIDMNNGIDTGIDTPQISIPENGQNRAQNGPGIDSIDILQDNGSKLQKIPDSIYRLGHSDIWACHNCKLNGDKWFMQKHNCKGGLRK